MDTEETTKPIEETTPVEGGTETTPAAPAEGAAA